MIPFALGGLLAYGAVFGAGLTLGWEWLEQAQTRQVSLLGSMFLLAAAVQALLGDVVGRVRRRRAFHPRVKSGLFLFMLGAIASVGAVVLTAFALPLLRDRVTDAGVFAAAAALSALLCVAFLPRINPARCILCHYDLKASNFPARCPECGEFAAASGPITPPATPAPPASAAPIQTPRS